MNKLLAGEVVLWRSGRQSHKQIVIRSPLLSNSPASKNVSGDGVNGCRRAKHTTDSGRGYKARRDRQMSNMIDLGTFVKSPDPYVLPDHRGWVRPDGYRLIRFREFHQSFCKTRQRDNKGQFICKSSM
jgi:hypothetical protein